MQRRTFLQSTLLTSFAAPLAAALRQERLDDAADLLAKSVASGQVTSAVLHVRQQAQSFTRAFGQAKSEQAPKDYRAGEQAEIAQAKAENRTAVAKQLGAMAGARDKGLGARDASALFESSKTFLTLRANAFLRSFAFQFIRSLSADLKPSVVREALRTAASRSFGVAVNEAEPG